MKAGKPAAAVAIGTGSGDRSGGQRSLFWLQGMLCGGMVALATPLAVLLAVLLAPGLAALLLDRGPGRPMARSVVLLALAASVSPLRALWSAGDSWSEALALACDPRIVGTAWLAAAAGWLAVQLAPLLARLALEVSGKAQAQRLRARQAELAAQWALENSADQAAPTSDG